ncbi:undecaprenyl-phosphate glucose phosphotransferase [Massilia sp. W12]|uniref:undecaprenyl-phosphate glucose phosphotransferase n=1 Tax=Massilia sp. W12 TaxID=3126507 RepID=UPI0030D53B7D
MTVTDIPLVSFSKRLLDPSIIWGVLYLVSWACDVHFSAYYLLLAIIVFFISGMIYEQIDPYRSWRGGKMFAYIRDIIVGWLLTVGILYLIGHVTGFEHKYDEDVMLIWFGATPFALIMSHMAVRRMVIDPGKEGESRSVIIIGVNDVGLKLSKRIADNPYMFMHLHGFFDDRDVSRQPPGANITPLGKMSDVADYVHKHNIKMVFISQPISAQPRIRKLLDELQDTTASVYFLPDIYVFDLMQARIDNLGGMPVVAVCETPFTGVNSVIKRASDLVLGSLILLMLLPIMLVVAAAVKITSPGPAIFKQRRYGLYGEEIIVYKFRSMTVADDGAVVRQAQKNDQRVTRVGAFLRKTSLDELPQFINVLQGRMSIVGPRPHAVAHNEMYRKLIKGYMLRHKVKPGITGWAQVNGLRGETETLDKMQARIEYDLDYVRNWSLTLDLWIIIRTVLVVAKRENAY